MNIRKIYSAGFYWGVMIGSSITGFIIWALQHFPWQFVLLMSIILFLLMSSQAVREMNARL